MEDQSPNLNTLSRSLIHCLRVRKGSMRHTASSAISLGIKAFNQSNQIRSLAISIVPLDIGVRLNGIRFSFAVGVDELDRNKITIWNRVCICHREWVFQDCLDGTPDVDDLVSAFQKLGSIFWEVEGDSRLGRLVGLVNVHALNWAAKVLTSGTFGLTSADGVVENVDSGGTSTIWNVMLVGFNLRWIDMVRTRLSTAARSQGNTLS